MSLRLNIVVALIAALILTRGLDPLAQTEKSSQRTILAVGAHAGDMEISCGAVLAKLVQGGDRVVMLHLTLGEGGNPRLSPQEYGRQKREEAKAAAASIGAEVLFGAYLDGEIPNNEGARRYVAEIIRQVKPSSLITHWRHSIHKDHVVTSAVTVDAELLASLAAVKTDHPPYGGVKAIFFTENWEDKEGFAPYTYVDVTGALESWGKCAKAYEFIRGGISSFPYFEYYRALAQVRGAEAGFTHAVAFDIDPIGKKQMLRALP